MLGGMPRSASAEMQSRFKQGYEWWNCGEPDLMLDEYAEDAELDLTVVFTDTTVYRGHAEMRRQIEDFWEIWEGIRMDPLEIYDLGGGRFVVEVRFWGKGKRSGVEVDQRFAWLYTLHPADDKFARSQLFPSVEAAMEFAAASAIPGS
jgi:ketosteroid isomerase-like protein